jgi:hypothetical protein
MACFAQFYTRIKHSKGALPNDLNSELRPEASSLSSHVTGHSNALPAISSAREAKPQLGLLVSLKSFL